MLFSSFEAFDRQWYFDMRKVPFGCRPSLSDHLVWNGNQVDIQHETRNKKKTGKERGNDSRIFSDRISNSNASARIGIFLLGEPALLIVFSRWVLNTFALQ